MHQAGSEWYFEDGSRLVGVHLKDPTRRRVMQLKAFVKEQQEQQTIKDIQEHTFQLKDGGINIRPRRDEPLKMRSSDPVTMEFLKRIDESAMFGICPGVGFKAAYSEIKAAGICIYTKKEIIVDKSGTQKVPLLCTPQLPLPNR